MSEIKKILIFCGHYGTGKTSIAINFSRDLADIFRPVILIDLDIVNPYFRTCDYLNFLKNRNVNLIEPVFARTTLDTPSLSAQINSAIKSETGIVVIDSGGDDAGVTALAQYADLIKSSGNYDLIYVVNKYRPMTDTVEKAVSLLYEIEKTSKLKVSGLINNSHLGKDTSIKDIEQSFEFAKSCARQVGLPLICTTVKESLYNDLKDKAENLYPMKIYTGPDWQGGSRWQE